MVKLVAIFILCQEIESCSPSFAFCGGPESLAPSYRCPILYDAKLCWVHAFALYGFLGLCVHTGASLQLHLGPLFSWTSDPRHAKGRPEISRAAQGGRPGLGWSCGHVTPRAPGSIWDGVAETAETDMPIRILLG